MDTYLIVDGYNVIHTTNDNSRKEDFDLEKSREDLIENLENYAGFTGYQTILVFDAYSQDKSTTSEDKRKNLTVVFTGKNITADAYIEKFVYDLPRLVTVKVVTSDYTLQRMILSNGGERIPSRELLEEMQRVRGQVNPQNAQKEKSANNKIADNIDDDVLSQMEKLRKG